MMLFDIPFNLFYTISIFVLMGFYNDIQLFLPMTLPVAMESMINSTLQRYSLEPTPMRISVLTSAINNFAIVGVIVSIVFILPLSDIRGSKYTSIYIRSLCSFVSSIFQLSAALFQSVEFYLVGELVFGIVPPIRIFSTAIFVSESSPDNSRGFTTLVLVIADSLAAMFLTSVTSPSLLGKPETWFVFPLLSLILCVLCFVLAFRIHESPKWLVRQNKLEKARRAIQFFHGVNNEEEVLNSMNRESKLTVSDKLSLKDIFEDETLREAVKIVILVYSFVWLSPIAVETTYSARLHSNVGFTIEQTLNIEFILSVILVPAKFLGPFLIDKIGRRKLIFLAGIIIIFSTVLLTLSLSISDIAGPSLLSKIIIVIVDVLNYLQLGMGLNSIGPLLVSELLPPSARTSVGQFLILFGVISYIPFMVLFPIINTISTPVFFVPFLVIQPVLLCFLYKNLPETNQRAVCDIIESLDDVVASRRTTMINEKSPLIKNRATSFSTKRGSILQVQRKRSETMDYNILDHETFSNL